MGCYHNNQFCRQTFKIGRLHPLFGTLAFQNGWQDQNSDFRILNGNDLSALCRNVARFRPATPEFMTLECVQPASIIMGVSLTTFARCDTVRHSGDQSLSLFHYYSLGGDTTRPGVLHARFYHAFPFSCLFVSVCRIQRV